MQQQERMASIAGFVFALILALCFMAQNVYVHKQDEFSAMGYGPDMTIRFGWPTLFLEGSVNQEQYYYGEANWFPLRFTSIKRILWSRLAVNLVFLSIMSWWSFHFGFGLQKVKRLRVSLQTFIGLTVFASIFFATTCCEYAEYMELYASEALPRRIYEDTFFYVRSVIWLSILGCCCTLPKIVHSMIVNVRKRTETTT